MHYMFQTQFLGKKKLLFTRRSEGGAGRREPRRASRVYTLSLIYVNLTRALHGWGSRDPPQARGGGCCRAEVVLVEAVPAVPLVVVVGGGEGDKRGRSGDNVCCGLCR